MVRPKKEAKPKMGNNFRSSFIMIFLVTAFNADNGLCQKKGPIQRFFCKKYPNLTSGQIKNSIFLYCKTKTGN